MPRAVFIGGSSGIGLATAERAVAAGWDVVVASRNPDRAEIDADKVVLDVTDHDAVRTFFAGLGSIDHLVSSTVARASGPVRELDLDAARHAFDVKLWGPLAAVQTADVRESIVLVSGILAHAPSTGGAATAAVNGAVEALTRTLAVELAPVRVNAVCPGFVDTPTWAGMPEKDREALFDKMAGILPAGRVGRADDLADGIWHLLTNGFVTGTVLHVDGGHRLSPPPR
jgi:NAD(P)-dependent dehydrogenase (short-subunit alcohol dehydrogenase family)